MTLTFKHEPAQQKLRQRSFSIVQAYRQTHMYWTDCFIWTINVVNDTWQTCPSDKDGCCVWCYCISCQS